jgi:hypothetical protein
MEIDHSCINRYYNGSEFLTSVCKMSNIFLDVMQCSLVEAHGRFGGSYFLQI